MTRYGSRNVAKPERWLSNPSTTIDKRIHQQNRNNTTTKITQSVKSSEAEIKSYHRKRDKSDRQEIRNGEDESRYKTPRRKRASHAIRYKTHVKIYIRTMARPSAADCDATREREREASVRLMANSGTDRMRSFAYCSNTKGREPTATRAT